MRDTRLLPRLHSHCTETGTALFLHPPYAGKQGTGMTIQRASVYHGQPYRYEEDTQAYDDAAPPRKPTSAINYTRTRTTDYAPVIRSGNRRYILHEGLPPPRTTPLSSQAEEEVVRPRRRVHWLVFVGLFMLTMLIGWVGLTMLANWWQVTQDDWHYGRPRTYQTDMVVGHNDSAGSPSHFIAINYNRHIEIIEFPGGDISHAKLYGFGGRCAAHAQAGHDYQCGEQPHYLHQ